MKKITIFTVIFICSGVMLSAQINLLSGIGFLYDHNFNNGAARLIAGSGQLGMRHITNLSGGTYLFLDVTYVEINVGFAAGFLFDNGYFQQSSGSKPAYSPKNKNISNVFQLNFSLLGKYPINIENITLFPLIGVNYNLFLVNIDGSEINSNYSQFGFQAGAGIDLNILSDKVYFRIEALFQLRIVSNDIYNYCVENLMGGSDGASKIPGIGPVIKAAFCYKFF